MHRAVIIGCGRIGVGYGDWPTTSYVYTHADAYLALKDRVELVGLIEPSRHRAYWAADKFHVPVHANMERLEFFEPDIVSVCVQPDQQQAVLKQIPSDVKGVWCEKPFVCDADWPWPIQVNYIRRFDKGHHYLTNCDRKCTDLFVIAKRDIHTVCHFVDLARMCSIPLNHIYWLQYDGPCSYLVRNTKEYERRRDTFSLDNGVPWVVEAHFPMGGMESGFMEHALDNLLNHIDYGSTLICPASEAVATWKATQELEAMWKAQA